MQRNKWWKVPVDISPPQVILIELFFFSSVPIVIFAPFACSPSPEHQDTMSPRCCIPLAAVVRLVNCWWWNCDGIHVHNFPTATSETVVSVLVVELEPKDLSEKHSLELKLRTQQILCTTMLDREHGVLLASLWAGLIRMTTPVLPSAHVHRLCTSAWTWTVEQNESGPITVWYALWFVSKIEKF